jgi:hypothetical protein
MGILQEGELEFSFPAAAVPRRFDGPAHGLSHCMKAVDFVVEFSSFHLFVEVKDPDNTKATAACRAKFAQELLTPVFPRVVTRKYRDSFLYRWAEQQAAKPVQYVVVLELSTLQSAEYLAISHALQQELPITNTPSSWGRQLAAGAAVLNVAQWNALGTYGTVQRI